MKHELRVLRSWLWLLACVALPALAATPAPLQPLIDATPPGGTLRLAPGSYVGPATITKPLTLEGAGKAVIRGDGRSTVLSVAANGVTIRSVRLTGSGDSHDRIDAGILLEGNDHLVEDNEIDDVLFGVHLKQVNRSRVAGNRVTGKKLDQGMRGDAIRLWYSQRNVIEGNRFTRARDLTFANSPDNRIVGNWFTDGRYGMHVIFSPRLLIENNRLSDTGTGIIVLYSPDLVLRATAKVVGDLDGAHTLSTMVNVKNEGRCAITLDPLTKLPGQQPYQGVVPLFDDRRNKLDKFSEVLQHYMLQSEQLDTTLVLAADDKTAAGLLIQRLPIKGEGNLAAKASMADEDEIGRNEDYNRISILAASLKNEELLQLDADTILRRLFWEEKLIRLETLAPSFACSCNRDRVSNMIRSLGADEVGSILSERNDVEVGCDFCGQQYRFDAVDAAQIFTSADKQVPGSSAIQ